jgi:orotidine-5'-phosphate decarboxylase
MVNVHASGGSVMMKAAKEATLSFENPPLLTAVTVLTSMDTFQLEQVYGHENIESQVQKLAVLAQNCGLDGVVCSAKEALMLRKVVNKEFNLVTPGIRPKNSKQDDQKRIMTPSEALQAGVDYLVIGRPITQADDPKLALLNINNDLQNT